MLYQINDDILDVTSSSSALGKDVNIDSNNGTITYVSLLGLEEAKNKLEEYKRKAFDDLAFLGFQSPCYIDMINFFAGRKS